MSTMQPYNKYLETSIQTATPAQLLLMLCDGAIRFCRQAISELREGRLESANTYLQKTQNIIDEFVITLDRSSPLAENLLMLYEYFKVRLTEANFKKAPEPAEEILGYLIELKENWMQASKLATQSQTGAAHGTAHSSNSTTVV
jgi:flagellar secretion chaperone FliS